MVCRLQKKKIARLKDIAEATGFSSVTVGKVLLGSGGSNVRVSYETRKKILQAAKSLKYSPNRFAQHLSGKSTSLIGAIIETFSNFRFQEILTELERLLSIKGYRLIIGQSHGELNQIKRHVADFASYRVQGIVCFSHDYPGREKETVELFNNQKNVVFIACPNLQDTSSLSYVENDVVMSSRISVEHLFNRGKKRIAIFILSSGSKYMADRLQGYQDGLLQRGLEFNPDLIFSMPSPIKPGHYDREIFERKILSLINEHKANALIMDDISGLLTLGILHQNNIRVPDDVSVVGSDNLFLSKFSSFPLTTVDFKTTELACRIGEILLEGIKTGETQGVRQEIVYPELIVRDSS